ncbi:MAG: hypothetical protein QOI12_5041 [Alphaproteobacteria bacterium]|jgi:hypothetical protein|nr:hypothetical protein [Alphaproteobacteria bacterium]
MPSAPKKKLTSFPTDATLLTSAALPSTATVVTVVTAAAVGADYVMKQLLALSAFESAVILFAAIVSFFATFVAGNLALRWRLVLWPVNFCVLVYLVISSSFFIDTVAKQSTHTAAAPTPTHVIGQTTFIPGE